MNDSFGNRKKAPKWLKFDFDKLEDMIDQLMENIINSEDFAENFDKPIVFGLSMKFDETGKPFIEEFGNIQNRKSNDLAEKEVEPLVNVLESKTETILTVELPGIKQGAINVQVVSAKNVEISALDSDKSFFKRIILKKPVVKKSLKSKFNNGILEIVFKRGKTKK